MDGLIHPASPTVSANAIKGRQTISPAWYRPLLLCGIPLLFVTFSLSTYRPWADGGAGSYTRGVLFLAGASMVLFGMVRLGTGLGAAPTTRRAWVPWAAMTVLLTSSVAVHASRVLHPVRQGAPYLSIQETFSGPDLNTTLWDVSAGEGARVTLERRGIRIDTPPGVASSLELHLPRPAWWTAPPAAWLLPVRFDASAVVEELEWRASVARTRTFFILLDTRDLLVQVAPYGAHLTTRTAGGDTTATELHIPGLAGGGEHAWRLRRQGGVARLEIDGILQWERVGALRLERVRFGETRSDELHGGTLRLAGVRYRRWWEPGAPAAGASGA